MKINKKLSADNSAFTLIELLVVIAIIGLLATISIVALNNARSKGRDAARVANVKQVQTALELFFNDNGRYPTAGEWNSGAIASSTSNGEVVYMAQIPSSTNPPDGACTSTDNQYVYSAAPDGISYTLSYCLGGPTGSLTSGDQCATPAGISNGAGCNGGGGGGTLACSSNTVGGTTCSYDGEDYPTATFGSQVWMTKNLDAGTMLCAGSPGSSSCSENPSNNGQIEKYCYYNNETDTGNGGCSTGGGLYRWDEATGYYAGGFDSNGNPTTNIQGICPSGWHIPTDADWHVLEAAYSTPPGDSNCDPARDGWGGCPDAGTTLLSNGSSGFNGITSGERANDNSGDVFYDLNRIFYMWSSSSAVGYPGYYIFRSIANFRNDIGRTNIGIDNALPIRCIKN